MSRSIPGKIVLPSGKGAERPFVSRIFSYSQTGVMNRAYQAHDLFDQWQKDNKHFVCKIKDSTKKICIEVSAINPGSNIFYNAVRLVILPFG